jgi:hypothetical protein
MSHRVDTHALRTIAAPNVGWYDFEKELRERILSHAHPPKTVSIEWTEPCVGADSRHSLSKTKLAKPPMNKVMQLTRERKRLTGPDLLDITMTRNVAPFYNPEPAPGYDPESAETCTWHNISRIRYYVPRTSYNHHWGRPPWGHNHFEFIGKDVDGSEITFHPADELGAWACWDTKFHRLHAQCAFEELGLTMHSTRVYDCYNDGDMLEYSFM